MKKNIVIVCLILIITYICISYFLLDGKLYYQTSFSSLDLNDSKKKNLFISDKLNVKASSDSVKDIVKNMDIWVEKQKVVDYYGFIFNWTSEVKNGKKLRMEKMDEYSNQLCCNVIRNNDTIEYSTVFPLFALVCKDGDEIIYDVYKCENKQKIGTIEIKIRK